MYAICYGVLSNIDNKNLVLKIRFSIDNVQSHHPKDVFQNVNRILTQLQLKNMLRTLTATIFYSNNSMQIGVYKCSDKRYKIWKLYFNQCNSFLCSNNIKQEICLEIACHTLSYILLKI